MKSKFAENDSGSAIRRLIVSALMGTAGALVILGFLLLSNHGTALADGPPAEIHKVSNGTVPVNGQGTFTITTIILAPATNVVMEDTLPVIDDPAGWKIVPLDPNCMLVPEPPPPPPPQQRQKLICNYGPQAVAGGQFTVKVQATMKASDCGILDNTADVGVDVVGSPTFHTSSSAQLGVFCPTPTPSPTLVPWGGVVEVPYIAQEGAAASASGITAIVGGMAAVAVVAAGVWYSRKRWSR